MESAKNFHGLPVYPVCLTEKGEPKKPCCQLSLGADKCWERVRESYWGRGVKLEGDWVLVDFDLEDFNVEPPKNVDAIIIATRRGFHFLTRDPSAKEKRLACKVSGSRARVEIRRNVFTPIESWDRDHIPYHVIVKDAEPKASVEEILGTVCDEPPREDVEGGGEERGSQGPRSAPSTPRHLEAAEGRLPLQAFKEIAEVIKKHYPKGHRNNLLFALVGMMIKNYISEEDACSIVEEIAEATGDEEKRKRVQDCRYQYKYLREGRKERGEYLGLKGLLAEYAAIGDMEAIKLIKEIIDKYRKNYDEETCVTLEEGADTRTILCSVPGKGLVKVKLKNGEPKSSKIISSWTLSEAKLFIDPDSQQVYAVVTATLGGESVVIDGWIHEVASSYSMKSGGDTGTRKAVADYITGLVREGKAVIERRYAYAGVYLEGSRLVAVPRGLRSWVRADKEDPEKAREALRLLLELRKHYDPRKFDVAILWAGYAPYSYALKVARMMDQQYLYLYGSAGTGKSTLARIIADLYSVTTKDGDIPEESGSPYRLGWKLNVTTLPLVEDEVESLDNKELVALLKRAATGRYSRWRGDTGTRYFARAALVFTSNHPVLLEDDAVARRLIPIEFGESEKVVNKPRDEIERFKDLLRRYTSVAPYLGLLLMTAVSSLKEIRHHDPLEVGRRVWTRVSEKLGVKPPWISDPADLDAVVARRRPVEEIDEAFIEFIKEWIVEKLRVVHHGNVIKIELDTLDLGGAAEYLAYYGIYVDGDYVEVTTLVVKEFERRYGLKIERGLKGFAERNGYEYRTTSRGGRKMRTVRIPVSDLFPPKTLG